MNRKEILKRHLCARMELENQRRISDFEFDHACPEKATYLGCYVVELEIYKKYKMDMIGAEGDHLPERLLCEWTEIHWEDISEDFKVM